MKILQLVTKRQYRGAEVFAANLSEQLISFNHEIIFAGLYNNDTDILSVDNATNVDLVGNKKGAFSLSLLKELIKLIRSTKPDVIQCNGSDTLKYMVAASFFVPEIPVIYRNISMISEWVGNSAKKGLYKRLFKRVAHVSSVGNEAIADFIKTFNYPKEQTSVIRRGIPMVEVNPKLAREKLENEFRFKSSDKICIHIGNFSPEKNHLFLLDIFSELKDEHSEIKLVLVGNGVLFQNFQEEIKNRGLEKTIFLTGFRKDIPELLGAAGLFVLCSKVEGVPGVILEAGMQKIPSIATNVGGVLEVLKNNETGYIIDNFDKQEFKNKIIELSINDTLRKKMGGNAHSLVLKEYDPIRNVRKFEELYKRLIVSHSSQIKSGKYL